MYSRTELLDMFEEIIKRVYLSELWKEMGD